MEDAAAVVAATWVATGAAITVFVEDPKVRVKISAVNTTKAVPNKIAPRAVGSGFDTFVSFSGDVGGEMVPISPQTTFPPQGDKLRNTGVGSLRLTENERCGAGKMGEGFGEGAGTVVADR